MSQQQVPPAMQRTLNMFTRRWYNRVTLSQFTWYRMLFMIFYISIYLTNSLLSHKIKTEWDVTIPCATSIYLLFWYLSSWNIFDNSPLFMALSSLDVCFMNSYMKGIVFGGTHIVIVYVTTIRLLYLLHLTALLQKRVPEVGKLGHIHSFCT